VKQRILFILSIIIISSSCVTKQVPQKTKTGASKYNPSSYVLHPQFKVFHEENNYSKLYFKIYTKELRFSSANENRTNQAIIKVSYKITPSIRSNEIIDSAKTSLIIKKIKKQTSIISFFKIKDIDLDQYLIEINLFDLYGNKKSQSYIRVNKSDDGNEQYYLSFIGKNQKPVFTEFFKPSDTLYIKTKKKNTLEMSVIHYNSNFKIANKPYDSEKQDTLKIKKDTSWKIHTSFQKSKFYSNKTGIYIIRADSTKVRGIMKVQFNNAYPLISKSDDMVEALAYILDDEELQIFRNSKNKKLSLDNFWIKTSKNKERAKELIKIWYNRATYSNYYFTSYKKGIKTDRGMIYTVIGPPDNIQYFDDAEKWIYTNTKNISKLEFIFVKQANSISNNDYTLIREGKYEAMWVRAIKTWRSGKVYKF